MRWHPVGIAGVLAGLFWGISAVAQAPPPTPILTQATRNGRLRFQIIAGRINLAGSRFGNSSSSSTIPGGRERLTIRFSNAERSVSYERSTSQEEFSLEITSDDRICIRRSGTEGSRIVPVEFAQVPDEQISLTLGADDQQQVYRAATLWHLLLTQPDECRQHLIPVLELLRSDWNLTQTAAAMETQLLRAVSAGQPFDRQRWGAWVAQLADERFSKREEADRALRSAGRVVLSYLRRLDFNRLDAEQQFRIRRIILSLSRQAGEDTAERFAAELIGDPDIWLAFLSRPEESTRRLAARHLGAILGEPIRFDPAAEPHTRKAQIEQLRLQVHAQGSQARI
jgi:hypothetical protein